MFGGLTDANFAGLNQLNFLNIEGNNFNTSIPSVFGQLPNLQFFYIGDSFITGDLSYMEGMPAIREHWNDINTGFIGTIPSFIGDLSTLESFSITQTGVFGTIPTELGMLTIMKQLWLYGNELTGTIPTELGLLSQMSLLQVEDNMFAGSMPAEICVLRQSFNNLDILGADCGVANVFCDCCTCCSFAECNAF